MLLTADTLSYHTKDAPPTYLTGHVLPKGAVRLGIEEQGFGVSRHISINTMLLGYLVWPFTGDIVPNVAIRVGTIHLDPFYLALESGFAFVYLGKETEETISHAIDYQVSTNAYAVPLLGAISYHPTDNVLCSIDIAYFFSDAGVRASASKSKGMMTSDSLQLGMTLQFALTRIVALTLKGRMVVWAPDMSFEVKAQLDETTELELYGAIAISSLNNAFQVVPGVAFSWKRFNLRLGVGYGHVFIPPLGLVSGYRGVVPDIELYFRF